MGLSPCRPFRVKTMPAKIIIAAPGRPATNGHKRRMFLWNPTFNCYVYENRVLDEAEFNSITQAVFKKHSDIRPYALIVADNGAVESKSMVATAEHEALLARYKALQARIGEPAPVATISAREVGLDEAVAIVQRLAPEKLRKTSQGRKPSVPMMEVG